MSLKPLALRAAKTAGLFALSRFLTRRHLRILCYHGIWLGPQPHYGDCLFMSASGFRRRLQRLEQWGTNVISLEEGHRRWRAGTLEARDVVITIDDAWAGTYLEMLPALKAHGYCATLYVPTENIVLERPAIHLLVAFMVERARPDADLAALLPGESLHGLAKEEVTQRLLAALGRMTEPAREHELERIGTLLGVDYRGVRATRAFEHMTPEELRDASSNGIDLELHTHTHRMYGFDIEQVRKDLDLNRQQLARLAAVDPDEFHHFCYPSGKYHSKLFPMLAQAGIVSATTTEVGLNPPGTPALALKRILDGESFSDLDIEARLSGFWSIVSTTRSLIRRMARPGAASA